MSDVGTHPTARALALYGQGRLPAAQAATVAAHLKTCADCRRVAAGLPPELAGHPKFRIDRELGRGGMGVIYLAQHRVLDKPVALKVISPAVLDNPEALARFHAEARAAAKLDHPNIARAYDADQAGDLHFLVMEFVEGQSLAQVLEQRGPLPVAGACQCARQAALGLQHAYEQGLVHRDIKPQNLMLTPKGLVKILDFGLARLRGERKGVAGLTQAEAFMGTPEYVAPEQAADARSADTRADVYSLGCTLYALLVGRPPFVEDTAVKMVLAHIEKEPAPLHEARPDVPAELSAVVAKMLAKDPARRYQRPVEVAQALAPFVKVGGSSASAPVVPPDVAAAGTVTRVGGDTRPAKQPGQAGSKPPRKSTVVGPRKGSPPDDPSPAPTPEPSRPAGRKRPLVLALAAGAVLGLVVLTVVIIAAARKTAGDSPVAAGSTEALVAEGKAVAVGPRSDESPPPEATPGTSAPEPNRAAPGPENKPEPAAPPQRPDPDTSVVPPTTPALTPPKPEKTAPAVPPPGDGEPDPIRDKLDKARSDYNAEVEKLRSHLLAALDGAKEKAQQAGKLPAVDQINKQRAAFEKDGTVPPSASGRDYQQKKQKARLALESAYRAAATEYTKAKMEARAHAVDQERKRLGHELPLDEFQPGTVWKGKGAIVSAPVKPGTKPVQGSFDVTLTVLTRDDDKFTARYTTNAHSWDVSGTITARGALGWVAKDVKPTEAGQADLRFDFGGQVSESALALRFRGILPDGRAAEGVLPLQLDR